MNPGHFRFTDRSSYSFISLLFSGSISISSTAFFVSLSFSNSLEANSLEIHRRKNGSGQGFLGFFRANVRRTPFATLYPPGYPVASQSFNNYEFAEYVATVHTITNPFSRTDTTRVLRKTVLFFLFFFFRFLIELRLL